MDLSAQFKQDELGELVGVSRPEVVDLLARFPDHARNLQAWMDEEA